MSHTKKISFGVGGTQSETLLSFYLFLALFLFANTHAQEKIRNYGGENKF
jgi:hypothetical protein